MDNYPNFYCKLYVNSDVVYEGSFSEVPDRYRVKIAADLVEWSDVLGKTGLNELIYSHLAWYEHKELYCKQCDKSFEDEMLSKCTQCGSKLSEKYVFDRNSKLDMLFTCIGMLSSIEVTTD